MKSIVTAALLTSAIVFTSMPLQAKPIADPKICIVSQALINQSAALKDIDRQLKEESKIAQDLLVAEEKKLQEENKKLAEAQKKLSEAEFTKKREALEKTVNETRARFELKKLRLELGLAEAKERVVKAFLEIVKKVKKAEGANLVFFKEAIADAEDHADISKKVLEELDKKLPSMPVTFKSEEDIRKIVMQQQGK